VKNNLSSFSDLPAALGFNPPETPKIKRDELLSSLGTLPKFPTDFKIERGRNWLHDGLRISEISWSVGYGPELLGGKQEYETLAVMHESMALSKYLSLFGATLAGLLNFDDRVAFAIANSLPEMTKSISVIGLSGGGARALLLHATQPELKATVSVGAMATYESMLGEHVAPHSWMFFPHGLAEKLDWPGMAILGDPTPLYIQYCENDQLFTIDGMRRADSLISRHYSESNIEYRGDFFQVKHSFTVEMQELAFDWLEQNA